MHVDEISFFNLSVPVGNCYRKLYMRAYDCIGELDKFFMIIEKLLLFFVFFLDITLTTITASMCVQLCFVEELILITQLGDILNFKHFL